jgi:hypothetical protein
MVIQFSGPLSAQDISELRTAHHLRLDAYQPERSYLERIDADQKRRLERDPRVIAVRPYSAATQRGRQPAPGVGVTRDNYRATLFDDADPADLLSTLTRLHAAGVAVHDDRPQGGRVRVYFTLHPASALHQVLAHRDVVLIETPTAVTIDAAPAEVPAGTWTEIAGLWGRGLHGEGQVIGMIDQGHPDPGHCFFRDVDPNKPPGPAHRKLVAMLNASIPGAHPTFVAGCAAGDAIDQPGQHPDRGAAWAARLATASNLDLAQTSTIIAELSAAAAAGACIHTNSWHHKTGSPPRYTQQTADVDAFTFAHEDHVVLGSVGNQGEEQGPPSTAKNAISVAAASIDATGEHFGDGASGPTADRRHKPDVMAPGCHVRSALRDTGCDTGEDPFGGPCASSFATPRAAGLAALIRQYFTEGWYPAGRPQPENAMIPSGALIKAILISAARPLASAPDQPWPSDVSGWGLLHPDLALAFAGGPRTIAVWDIRHAGGPTTGEVRRHQVQVPAGSAELRVTLAWSDPPPAAVADLETTLVNRLRLCVTGPDGGEHTDGNAAPDPVASVVVAAPEPGEWVLAVEASEVNVGAPGQGYGLVAAVEAAPHGPE